MIPSAFDRCTANELTAPILESFGRMNPSATPGIGYAGKNAIGKVWNGEPVQYASARGFIHLANAALAARGKPEHFELHDVVACVFRLKDAPDVANALKLSAWDIATGCRLNVDIVTGALKKYRLPYRDADTIWRFLLAKKEELTSTPPDDLKYLTSAPEDLLKVDVRNDLPMGIYRTSEKDFVHKPFNVSPAPRRGHPWALDDSPAVIEDEAQNLPPQDSNVLKETGADEAAEPRDPTSDEGSGAAPPG